MCSGLVYPRYQLISQQNKIFGGSFRRVFEYFFSLTARLKVAFQYLTVGSKGCAGFKCFFYGAIRQAQRVVL